jgi:NAD(P)H-hydrate epimerase
MKIEGQKVISAEAMKTAEQKSIEAGADDEAYMKQAAAEIAREVELCREKLFREKQLAILVGKGNNGGDALAAACHLLDQGYKITAFLAVARQETSNLSKKFSDIFCEKGGDVRELQQDQTLDFFSSGMILDGLFGTGFSGEAKDTFAVLIKAANDSKIPIISIDIPSGLSGNDGKVEGPCIQAYQTIYLGLPKTGFFFGDGFNYIGNLIKAEFGIEDRFLREVQGVGCLLHEMNVKKLAPKVVRNRHKYQAGYVLTVGGSRGMGGAPVMAAHGALKAGAGMSRLFSPEGMKMDLINCPVEIIKTPYNPGEAAPILEEAERAKVAVLGPGLGRTKEAFKILDMLLKELKLPCVLDADALFFLAKNPKRQFSQPTVLTPHRQEMMRLFGQKKPLADRELIQRCQEYCEEKRCSLVLKGAPSWIFHPKTTPLISIYGSPGMATAGSGDVLAGILGGIIAQGLELREAAAFSVFLHGLAGKIAANNKTPYCMTATDILHFLPNAFASL